jgi:small subunit ribosomal protein S9
MIETENNELIENKASIDAIEVQEEVKVVVPKIDKLGRAYATGKRKSSIARVWLKLGSGKIIVNGIECEKYFKRETHRLIISQPLEIVSRQETYDINCSVVGGGHTGQAGALRHGVSKALTFYEPELRGALKAAGLIKRDARRVERKKYGQPKARRSFQFSKR